MANNDVNFTISTEGLEEKGIEIKNQVKLIRDALNEIEEARKTLDGWVSKNKDIYDNKINAVLPKMNEMVEAIDSYSKVAMQTSKMADNVETRITSAINNEGLI